MDGYSHNLNGGIFITSPWLADGICISKNSWGAIPWSRAACVIQTSLEIYWHRLTATWWSSMSCSHPPQETLQRKSKWNAGRIADHTGRWCSSQFTHKTHINTSWLVVWNIWTIFPYIGNNHPNWLIFFSGVEATNQKISHLNSRWAEWICTKVGLGVDRLGHRFLRPVHLVLHLSLGEAMAMVARAVKNHCFRCFCHQKNGNIVDRWWFIAYDICLWHGVYTTWFVVDYG